MRKWWGAATFFGSHMPYDNFDEKDLSASNYLNQSAPLFVSSKGRYIWSDKPFKFSVKDGVITIESEFEKVEPVIAHKTLKDAYLGAAKMYFDAPRKSRKMFFFDATVQHVDRIDVQPKPGGYRKICRQHNKAWIPRRRIYGRRQLAEPLRQF